MISNNKYKIIVFLFMSSIATPSHHVTAVEIEGLFEVSVEVSDQSNRVRKAATKQALIDVIVRLSGQSSATSNPTVRAVLRKPSNYIQHYLYRDQQTETNKQLMLDLFFDEQSLRTLLRKASLPRWSANRPQVLIWVAIGDENQRFLMGTDGERLLPSIIDPSINDPLINDAPFDLSTQEFPELPEEQPQIDLKQTLSDVAAERGLPIIFPLMDLEDSFIINVADIWGGFLSPIRTASERYQNDAVLSAKLIKSDDLWLSQWLLLHKGRTISWELSSTSVETALVAGMHETTNKLASQYAVFEDSVYRNELMISVNNVEQIDDYANLLKYLQGLTSVHSVNVDLVDGATIQLRLGLIGEAEAMLQSISLNKQLIVDNAPKLNNTGVIHDLHVLYFHWNTDKS